MLRPTGSLHRLTSELRTDESLNLIKSPESGWLFQGSQATRLFKTLSSGTYSLIHLISYWNITNTSGNTANSTGIMSWKWSLLGKQLRTSAIEQEMCRRKVQLSLTDHFSRMIYPIPDSWFICICIRIQNSEGNQNNSLFLVLYLFQLMCAAVVRNDLKFEWIKNYEHNHVIRDLFSVGIHAMNIATR